MLDCSRTDLVGGHVMKCDGRSSNEWWLAPICKGHVSCMRFYMNSLIAHAESSFEH